MQRKIHIGIICFSFGLSVLIISRSQVIDNTERSYRTTRKYLEDEIPTNGLFNISNVLEETRHKIREELRDYNYSYSGVNKLEDLLIEEGGQPVRSLIISTWRSGTTFLGQVLNAMPGNFYYFEPLLNYRVIQIRGPPRDEEALSTIKSIFKCNYSNMNEFLRYKKEYIFEQNTRLWNYCKLENKLCSDSDFIGAYCKLFPFQSMKVVRLRLRLIQDIIRDTELNVKVVLLIRDPRGVLQSRQHDDFCQQFPDCSEPELLCADMVSDYTAARTLLHEYPDKLMVLRFEELALKPNAVIRKLLRFLGLSMMIPIKIFLLLHTNDEKADLSQSWSTYRVSRDVPFKWKHLMNFTHVNEIQLACKKAMDLWGYRVANNETHMKSEEFNPLKRYFIK